MKLVNKKTGEVATLTLSSNGEDLIIMGNDMYAHITKLSELKDYEDYEEPKEYWTIDWTCTGVTTNKYSGDDIDEFNKSIGNYFETREEAEKAVEKLKAWKRLKDNGVSFEVTVIDRKWYLKPKAEKQQRTFDDARDLFKDVKIVFGGEE